MIKDVLGLHSRNLINTSLVPEDYSTKLIWYYHGEILMLIMGLYSKYISKTTSDYTSLFTSLQHKNDNAL